MEPREADNVPANSSVYPKWPIEKFMQRFRLIFCFAWTAIRIF